MTQHTSVHGRGQASGHSQQLLEAHERVARLALRVHHFAHRRTAIRSSHRIELVAA